jgi:hypothetical protein
MTKVVWKKFSEVWPKDSDFPIWKADIEYNRMHIHLTPDGIYGMPRQEQVKDELYWTHAEIQSPAPPEKKRHSCSFEDSECYEDRCSRIFLKTYSQMGRCVHFPVVACPFCGYTKEQK